MTRTRTKTRSRTTRSRRARSARSSPDPMIPRPADGGGSSPGMRGTAFHERFVLAVAALFVCSHLAWLPRHLEDIDSINFALGLRHYDVAAHQPHPPGYPLFIALARASRRSCRRSHLTSPRAMRSPWPILAGLSGACALLLLYRILVDLREDAGDAGGAAAGAHHHARRCDTAVLGDVVSPLERHAWPGRRTRVSVAAVACGARGRILARGGGRGAGVRRRHRTAVAGDVARGAPAGVGAAAGVAARRPAHGARCGGRGDGGGALVGGTDGGDDRRHRCLSRGPDVAGRRGLRRRADAGAPARAASSRAGTGRHVRVALGMVAAGGGDARHRRSRACWRCVAASRWPRGSDSATARTSCTTCCSRRRRRHGTRFRWCPRGDTGRAGAGAVGAARRGAGRGRWPVASRSGCRCSRTSSTSAPVRPSARCCGAWTARRGSPAGRPQVLMHRRVWAETRRARATLVPDAGLRRAASAACRRSGRARWRHGGPARRRSGGSSIHAAAIAPPSIRAALRVREHVAWPMPVGAASRRHAAARVRLVRRHRTAMGAARWLGPDARTCRDHGGGQAGTICHAGATALVRGQAGASTLVIGGRYLAPSPEARRRRHSRSGLATPICRR